MCCQAGNLMYSWKLQTRKRRTPALLVLDARSPSFSWYRRLLLLEHDYGADRDTRHCYHHAPVALREHEIGAVGGEVGAGWRCSQSNRDLDVVQRDRILNIFAM